MNFFKVLAAILLALAVSLFLVNPGYAEGSSVVSALIPAGICMGLIAKITEDTRKLRAKALARETEEKAARYKADLDRTKTRQLADQKAKELETGYSTPMEQHARRRELEILFQDGSITAAEARDAFARLSADWANTAGRRVPGLTDHRTPMAQLEAVSEQYGLPVNVGPPVSAGGLIKHVCMGPGNRRRYFQDASYCPEHRDQAPLLLKSLPVITEAEPLPAAESLHDQILRITGTCSCPACTSAEQALKRRRQALEEPETQPETRPEDLLPDPVAAADEAAESYVPEGEAELLENLRRDLRAKWNGAEDRRQDRPRTGHWEMSEAWAADVRKLRNLSGTPVWKPGSSKLYGYPVETDAAYGVPELKEI